MLLDDNDMLPEYDFSNAKRAPYAEHFREAGVRTLDADLREAFPSSESVNTALRSLLESSNDVGLRELKRAS
jgi:hypothetical protein